jgi:hypothetical protein
MHALIERLRRREDTEHEQVVVKFIMGVAWLLYILWAGNYYTLEPEAFTTPVLYLASVVIIFAWIIVNPGIHPQRRLLGIFLDALLVSYALLHLGKAGALLIGSYLFITLGHGFRYGNKYLFASALMNISGITVVMTYGDY